MSTGTATGSSDGSATTSSMTMSLLHANFHDSLLWASWTPHSRIAYALTFLALVLLGLLSRGLIAYMAVRERQVRVKNMALSNIIVQALSNRSEKLREADADSTSLVKNNANDTISASSASIETDSREQELESKRLINPWRISVDVPRGLMQFVSSGVGYLLMLAVMTGNVGYLFGVLTGIFIGEVAFGRYVYAPVAARQKSNST